MLLFWTSNDDELSGLKGRLAGGQEPPNILHSIAEGSSISQYYNAEEDIPIEWLVFLDTTSTSGQKIALQTIKKSNSYCRQKTTIIQQPPVWHAVLSAI
jgi:hypothetical protein